MAYSKVSNKTQNKDIQYLSKDFNSFRDQLINFAENYFPENFNDFSESNPGMIFLELASYVGDVLSFYTDTQLRESFLTLAQEKENLYNLAYAMGYKPKVTSAATTDLEIAEKLIEKSFYINSKTLKVKYNYGYVFVADEDGTDEDRATGKKGYGDTIEGGFATVVKCLTDFGILTLIGKFIFVMKNQIFLTMMIELNK